MEAGENQGINLTIEKDQTAKKKRNEYCSYDFYKQVQMLIAEVIGTGLLVFFGCIGCIDWFQMTGLYVVASVNFGLTVMFVVQSFGHISFAIINPAIVVTAFIHKLINLKLAVLYIVAEIVGAILGYGLLYVVTPFEFIRPVGGGNSLCITNLHPSISVFQGFLIEFVVTSVLVLVVCSVWDPRNKDKSDSAAIKLGLAVATLCIAAAPATVASMNPARSIGPAIWNWEWENHWMYWLSSFSASIFTSNLYRYYFWEDPTSD